jgi:hypothetical protein
LLDPPAALVDRVGAELDDLEGVEDRGRVGELVVDGVLVAVERIQRRDGDLLPERLAVFLEPVGVDLPPGPAGNQVEEPGPNASVLVTGQ